MNSTEQPAWRKSQRCGNSTCVEIAPFEGGYLIRDSKNPDQEPLRFTEEELAVFAAAFTAGEFRSE
ncbi:DUF397 domain-containing protein [Actinoplanes sp. NPDC049599]|uniref:DUF397 domain-containing protein n=1 Tax=Actinoplanes sp. NPDC049599 TaxID=3363903 RepID=UPI0037939E99